MTRMGRWFGGAGALAALVLCALLGACSDDGGSSGSAADASADASADAASWTFLDSYPVQAQFPEGGAVDLVAGALYHGSLGDGSVHRVDLTTGADTQLFVETAAGTWWTLGLDVDSARKRLWVCAMDDRSPKPRAGSIWVFDLVSGDRIANLPLAAAAADATCTDVVVAADGKAFVVDRELPNIYQVDVDAGVSLYLSDPALKGSLAGQNAIVLLPGGTAALSVVYLPPALAYVDLQAKTVHKVEIDGTFSDDAPLGGADGMAYADGNAYVAFTSRLVRLVPADATWTKAKASAVDVANGMTDVIATPAGLYLLNGQSVRFALKQATDPFAFTKFTGAFGDP